MFNEKKKLIDKLEQDIEEYKRSIAEQNNVISQLDITIQKYSQENAYLQSIISNEQLEADKVFNLLENKKHELSEVEKKISSEKDTYEQSLKSHQKELDEIESKIVKNSYRYDIQSYGFYEPIFSDKCSDDLKQEIKIIRSKQKEMLTDQIYYICNVNWTVNNSETKGNTLIKRQAKNYITSFNLMCDAIIDRVSVSNIQKTKDKIEKTFDSINRQAKVFDLMFSPDYLYLKLQELDLMYCVAIKKEEEREERRQHAEMIKEQKKVEKEIQKQREKLEKELQHYQNNADGNDVKISQKIEEIQKQIEENDYRKNNSLAGYVYIIENKSFSDGIYKIGVTRRLEPLDRIAELSNASVPFKFKPNCIIFSENAFQLESDLHKEFDAYRVNKINKRKEYFQVPLQTICDTIKNKYGLDVEFNFSPENEEWEVSDPNAFNGVDDEDDED